MIKNCYTLKDGKIHLYIKAVPGSSKNQAAETKEGRLKVKIAAPAEDGKANEELRSFLAKILECPKKETALLSGEKSRLKTITLPVSAEERLKNLINSLAAGAK